MRELATYDARTQPDGSVALTRYYRGEQEELVATDWVTAFEWLVRPPAGSNDAFTVVFNLVSFSLALFSLLPEDKRQIIVNQDRVFHDNCKVFYVNGRYLGLTTDVPLGVGNQFYRAELNLQALKWWVTEEETEPADVKETWEIGTRIVTALDGLGFYPTKLTSPVGVFTDCFLGDARKYPTIFSWPEDKFEAMEYATEMMRFEWRSAYQVGMFTATHLYDLVGAYPAVIARLPNTDGCRCEYATRRPEWATWGICYGEVQVDVDVSPLVFDMGDGNRINPRGRWTGYFTTREIEWLERWKAGSFKLQDGWFMRFGEKRPYREAMNWLHDHKTQSDRTVSGIARKMAQGVSGKLDEDRQDGKKGDYYNPLLACMTRSENRIAVADFIYEHGLAPDLVGVIVDSVLSTKPAGVLKPAQAMGSWRYEGATTAIVLSKGNIWRPGKRPQGIGYMDILKAMRNKPDSGYYEFTLPSGSVRSIDLMLDGSSLDREFGEYPDCGGDVLENVYRSTAIEMEA